MIIELPRRTEHFGAVQLNDTQRVYELDSGITKFATKSREAVATISNTDIEKINQRMAIVIPIKDERLKLLEGVLSGIPHDCYVIVVSGSQRSPVDRFMMETQMLKRYNHFVEDDILMVHQKDPGLSGAFRNEEFDSILDKDGLVRSGKAEAMFIGILLAKMLGKDFVGFIDADNYVPGAVHEYVDIYSAGFTLAESPYSMVRVSWIYKPKIVEDRFFFSKWGRVSKITNYGLNQLIESYTGFGTEIIKTGNSGEHAMSVALAELMYYASGFAVEPYEIINLLEQFGGINDIQSEVISSGVDVFQIETRNPHLHEQKGDAHINEMLLSSVGAMCRSPICPKEISNRIITECENNGFKIGKEPPGPIKIRPPFEINLKHFTEDLKKKSQTLTELR